MNFTEINNRYSVLADTDCCLSCGGAINYADARKGEFCIDLGSGRGTDVIRLSDIVGENGLVYGIDISDGMIEKARITADKFGKTNVKFIKSELENIPLSDNIANLIISNCTINHASDKQKVWNEIYRLLKNDGRFVISDIYSIEKVPDKYHNDPVAVAECWAGAVTRSEYIRQIKNAGFSSIEIIEESKPYCKGKILVASFTIIGFKKNGESHSA